MLKKYSEESEKLIEEIIQNIQKMDSNELGNYFDYLYMKLNNDFHEYHWYLDESTERLEKNMTEDEIKVQESKMSMTNSKIGRPRSYHEITYQELFDISQKSFSIEEEIEYLKTIER